MRTAEMLYFYTFLYLAQLLVVRGQTYRPKPVFDQLNEGIEHISKEDVEEAFVEAYHIIERRQKLEMKLFEEGRIVDRKLKTADSTQQPVAGTPPINREMEFQQQPFEEASRILSMKYQLNPKQVAFGLPKVPLNTPLAAATKRTCLSSKLRFRCDPDAKYRTQNSSCNNLNNPTWGSAPSCFNRILPPIYTVDFKDKTSVDGHPLPEPRTISTKIHSDVNQPSPKTTHLFLFFGQLLDHDITDTPKSTTVNNEAIQCCPPMAEDHPQCAPISISPTDSFYSQHNVSCINFVRSNLCSYCTLGPRKQVYQVTGFVDVSFAYGNQKSIASELRTNDGTGRLRVQHTAIGDLLPPSKDVFNDQCSIPKQNLNCFETGDARANQNPMLISLQTLFVREHNRVAGELKRINPGWGEEQLYQEARKIVGAEMQAIAYKDYLPLALGEETASYFQLHVSKDSTTYDQTVNPTVLTEFSTACFRFGHTLINNLITEDPATPNHFGHWLRDVFFHPFGLYDGEMNLVLNGATKYPSQSFDRYVVADVTNFLYRIRGTPTGLDLVSINIQRSRDHGLQGYTSYVRFCSRGEVEVKDFSDLVHNGIMPEDVVAILSGIYSNVHDIDLFSGMISEIPMKGAVVGPTGACVIGLQFHRLKFGDRFYFENGGQRGSFTNRQRDELRKVSLAKLLCDNINLIELQTNVFLFPSPE